MTRGTIRQRGSRFTVILDRGTDPLTGKRRRESHSGYRTRKEAERARTKLLRELDEGRYVDRSQITVAKYLREERPPASPSPRRPAAVTEDRSALAPGRPTATCARPTSFPTSAASACKR